MVRKKYPENPANVLLGKRIARLRLKQGLSLLQLGRKINKKEQQIAKYENGDFVPLPVIEALGEALGDPVRKRTIRRISFLRKLQEETGTEQAELPELYQSLFCDPENDQA